MLKSYFSAFYSKHCLTFAAELRYDSGRPCQFCTTFVHSVDRHNLWSI